MYTKQLLTLIISGWVVMPFAIADADTNSYPTVDRVEFVMECIYKNSAPNQQFIYQCSCAIDEIAKEIDYEKYVKLSVLTRYKSMGGERGGVFRDPPEFRKARKGYNQLVLAAKKKCNVPK